MKPLKLVYVRKYIVKTGAVIDSNLTTLRILAPVKETWLENDPENEQNFVGIQKIGATK